MSYRQEIVGDTFYWRALYINIVRQNITRNDNWNLEYRYALVLNSKHNLL